MTYTIEELERMKSNLGITDEYLTKLEESILKKQYEKLPEVNVYKGYFIDGSLHYLADVYNPDYRRVNSSNIQALAKYCIEDIGEGRYISKESNKSLEEMFSSEEREGLFLWFKEIIKEKNKTCEDGKVYRVRSGVETKEIIVSSALK
jgi:hypothetical protein